MAGAELVSGVTTAAAYDAAEVVGPADQSRGGSSGSLSTTSGSSGTSCACSPRRASRPPSSRRRRPPPTSLQAASTASSCPTGPAIPPRPATGSPPPPRVARTPPALRDLPRPPAAGPRAGGAHVQDALRTSGREPAGPRRAVRRGADHEPQPRVRRRSHRVGGRDGTVRSSTASGRVELSHRNLNDDTLEGLRCRTSPPSRSSTTRRRRPGRTMPPVSSSSSGRCSSNRRFRGRAASRGAVALGWNGRDVAPTQPVLDPRDRLGADRDRTGV